MSLITTTKINQLPAGSKQIAHGGVTGLVYMPSTSHKGKGSWRLRYLSPLNKKAVILTIAQYPAVGIADAATKARELNKQIDSGIDPRLEIKKKKHQQRQAQLNTFERIATDFVREKIVTGAWRNQSYGDNTLQRLKNHVFPALGSYQIEHIQAVDIKTCLLPIWHSKQETANKLLTYIGQIFTWAESQEMCQHNPVKAAKVALGKQATTKSPTEKHMPAMQWKDIPSFIAGVLLEGKPTQGKYALLFQILNAARSGAVRHMEFGEVNFDTAIWTMPALAKERKTNIDRYYPLSIQAMALLRYQQQDVVSSLIFPSPNNENCPLSEMTLNKILKDNASSFTSDIEGRYPVPHGFRSAFRNWASENGYDEKWAELQLAHEVGNKVQRAYDRSPLIEQRRTMMQAWADFCFAKVTNCLFISKNKVEKENNQLKNDHSPHLTNIIVYDRNTTNLEYPALEACLQ